MSSGSDKRANLERAEGLIRGAAKQGAGLVVLPEVFEWRGPRGTEAEFAEPIPGVRARDPEPGPKEAVRPS